MYCDSVPLYCRSMPVWYTALAVVTQRICGIDFTCLPVTNPGSLFCLSLKAMRDARMDMLHCSEKALELLVKFRSRIAVSSAPRHANHASSMHARHHRSVGAMSLS